MTIGQYNVTKAVIFLPTRIPGANDRRGRNSKTWMALAWGTGFRLFTVMLTEISQPFDWLNDMFNAVARQIFRNR